MELKFRDLRADEIECRVGMVKQNGFTLLLYKDSRCDMNILDETVGCLGWQRRHSRDNANCIVSLWDDDKKQWIEKEDTGTESNTEAEKGLASDSFKRACVNIGIGRELYTAPFIWITNGDPKKDKFVVDSITVKDKKITALSIKNAKTGEVVYTFGGKATKSAKKTETPAPTPEAPKTVAETAPKKPAYPNRNKFIAFCKENNLDTAMLCKELELTKDSPDVDFIPALSHAVKAFAKMQEEETGVGLPFEI